MPPCPFVFIVDSHWGQELQIITKKRDDKMQEIIQEQLLNISTIRTPMYNPNATPYLCKVITAGNKQQFYNYTKPQYRDYDIIRENYEKSKEGQKRQDNLQRTRNKMVLLIDSNVTKYTKFITLTFAKTTLDATESDKAFKHFQKSFKRQFGYALKYVRIMERQLERGIKEGNIGSIHYHMVVFNESKIPYKELKAIWKQYGSIDIRLIDDVSNVGRYMAKYLTKYSGMLNKKGYTSSKNLMHPTIEYLPFNYNPTTPSQFNNSYIVYQPNQQNTSETVCNFTEYHKKQRETVNAETIAIEWFGNDKVTVTT